MTFKDIVFRNFRHGLRKYLSFYICSTFAIAIFFIFSTLLYNEDVIRFLKSAGRGSDYSLYFALGALGVFSIIFIQYVHTSMKRSRSKEFGLYMTMGMSARDIGKSVVLEDVLLAVGSFLSGILSGMLFSRIIHMIIAKTLELDNLSFKLNMDCFLLTGGVFIVIFLAVILIGWRSIKNLQISDLIRHDRMSESIGKSSPRKLLVGVALMIVFFTGAIGAVIDRNLALKAPLMLMVVVSGIAGIYLVISQSMPLILNALKRKKNIYYSNLLVLAETGHNISKNRKFVFVLSLLSAAIIYCISSSMALYTIIEDIIETLNTTHLSYYNAFKETIASRDEIDAMFQKEHLKVTYEASLDVLFVRVDTGSSGQTLLLPAFRDTDIKGLLKKPVSIPEGSAALMIPDPLDMPEFIKGISALSFGADLENLSPYTLLEPIVAEIASEGAITPWAILMNPDDYDTLKQSLSPGMTGQLRRYSFENWKASRKVYDEMVRRLESSKQANPESYVNQLIISGAWRNYEMMKSLFSTFIFIFVFLSILFMASSVMVLLMRQYESLDKARRKYRQIRKIGVQREEYAKVLKQEIRILYMIPILFGILLAYGLMFIIESVIGGNDLFKQFMESAVLFTAGYVVLQFVSSLIAGRRYSRDVMAEHL